MTKEPIWWLLPDVQLPGALQMALDHWLLEQHRCGALPPCLRFYRWSRPSLSLGYHQRHWPQAWASVPGIDWVRRPSGGRAVLHSGRDLTYALVGSGWSGDRQRAYEQICRFLQVGFRSLGEPLQFGAAQTRRSAVANCFALATVADLRTAAGLKRIGSAQTWQGDCVLQHGAIRLGPDPQLWWALFGEPAPMDGPAPETVRQALVEAAVTVYGVRLHPFPGDRLPWSNLLARAEAFGLPSRA